MSSSKTVLFYAPALGRGGVATAFCALAEELESYGYNVKVLLPYETDFGKLAVPRRYVVACARKRPLRNKLLIRILNSVNVITRYQFFFLGMPKIPHDIFVVYSVPGNAHWVHYSKRPVIGWVHGIDADYGGRFIDRIWKMSNCRFLRKYCAIFGISFETSEWFSREHNSLSVRTVPNLIDINKIHTLSKDSVREERDNSRKIILYVGRISREKGLMRVLRTLSGIDRFELDRVRLFVVGDGPERNICQEFALEHGLNKIVSFLGMKENPYPYMRMADLLILPSIMEGFGLVMWEALLCRTAVMATDCSGPTAALNGGLWGKIVANTEDGIKHGILDWIKGADYAPKCGFDQVELAIRNQDSHNRRTIEKFIRKVSES